MAPEATMVNESPFKDRNRFLVSVLIATANWSSSLDHFVPSSTLRRFISIYNAIANLLYLANFACTLAYGFWGKEGTRPQSLLNAYVNLHGLHFLSQLVFFTVRRGNLDRVIQLWDASFQGEPFPKEERQEADNEQRKNKVLITLQLAAIMGSSIIYHSSFLTAKLQELRGGRLVPLPAIFPFDALKSPVFEFVVCFQFVVSIVWAGKSVGFTLVYFTLVSMQTAKMKHLAWRLEKLFDPVEPSQKVTEPEEEEEDTPAVRLRKLRRTQLVHALRLRAPYNSQLVRKGLLASEQHPGYDDNPPRNLIKERLLAKFGLGPVQAPDPQKVIKDRLKLWVQHHQQSIRLMREMNNLFSQALLEKFALAPMNLCVLVLYLFKNGVALTDLELIACGSFLIYSFFEMFVYCRYGDFLADAFGNAVCLVLCHQHGRLAVAASGAEWTRMRSEPVIGSSLLVIEFGVRIPMKISSLSWVTVSTQTFVLILNRAYGQFLLFWELVRLP